MTRVAVPPDKVPEPICVVLSMKLTAPVGVPPLPVTVAVKVTGLPYADGLEDDVTPVVVVALLTVCERTDDVDVAKLAIPA